MAHRMAAIVGMALFVLPAQPALSDTPQLNAKFNADRTFSMWTQDGTPLGSPSPPGRVIPAGYYAVNVDDTAEIGYMSFLLQGPGVSLRTTNDEGASASLTFNVTLQPGSTYSYGDSLNPSLPLQYFSTSGTVGSTQAGSASTTTGTPSSGATQSNTVNPVGASASKSKASAGASTTSTIFRGDLQATVGKSGRLTFELNGKKVSSLIYGRYKITVSDGSPKNGFIVQEAGLDPVTVSGVPFVGKRSATVELAVGQWLYYPTVIGKKTYFLVTR